MKKFALLSSAIAIALASQPAAASPRILTGEPDYANEEARALVEEMLAAHGGTEPWSRIDGLRFDFFTKVIGNNSPPFLSVEHTNFRTGNTLIEWPMLGAQTGYDGKEVWSQNWRGPLPPGFFVGLTTSFITLPWLTQRADAHISAPRIGALPFHDEIYNVVTLTFDEAGPHVPGDFYELFIDRQTHLLEGIGFNITHPFMMRIANQAIGPNYHRIVEYTEVEGLKIPSYYVTHGFNQASGNQTEAMHSVFGLQADDVMEEGGPTRPADAVTDEMTSAWWADSIDN